MTRHVYQLPEQGVPQNMGHECSAPIENQKRSLALIAVSQ